MSRLVGIPWGSREEGDEIHSVKFIKGVPFIIFYTGSYRHLNKEKAPKSYFESLGIIDDTDKLGKPIEP